MENKQVDIETRKKLLELVSLIFDLNQEGVFQVALELKGYLSDDSVPCFELRIVDNNFKNDYFCAASISSQYDTLGYSNQTVSYENLVRAITWLKRKHKEATGLNDHLIARLQDIPEYWRCEDFDNCPHIEDFQELLERHDKLTADEPSYKNSRAWEAWAEQHDYLSDVIGDLKKQYEDFKNV